MLMRQLEYFAAVVDTGSFTRAAERCYISQSAVSQQVKALEQELGCELVHREGRRFSLTPAGEAVLSAAHDVLNRVSRMRFEVEHASEGGRRELTVGYLSRYGSWEVQGAVAAFTLRHPEVKVTARPGSHEDLYEMMLSGVVDLAFSDRRRELSDEFENVPLMRCRTFVEVSEANPLSAHDELSVSELGDTPCILVAHGDARAAERDYYRDTLNFSCPFLFAETLDEAHMMVAGNRGFLPVESHGDEPAAGGVIRHVPLMGPEGQLTRDYYAFWPRARGSWMQREFAGILAELLA